MADQLETLKQKFANLTSESFRDNTRVIVPATEVYAVLQFCKNQLGYDLLSDVTAVDYLEYPNTKDRFGVIYVLTNTGSGDRLIVKTYVNDPEPSLPSVWPLWAGSDWLEREVYDMFGIRFDGHPDLRRILLPEEFVSFPLRKDYPQRGKGERHNFPSLIRAEG